MTTVGGQNSAPHFTNSHPTIVGFRLTDANTVFGAILWSMLVAADILSTVELFVALAVLVILPLGLGVAMTPRRSGRTPLVYRLAVFGQPPAAILAVASFTFPTASVSAVALTLPWVAVTACVALFGLWRLLPRGFTPLPELAIDAALLYVPVGAVALFLSRAGISFHFKPIIILLTVVHYHYAGFALPLIAGMAGRLVTDDSGRFGSDFAGRAMAATTLVIVVNLALIAIGITFSPLVEVVAVAFFTVAVVVFALSILGSVVLQVDRVRGVLLSLAAVAVVWTMALALAYGYSAYPGTPQLVTIDEMIV
ncbi:YndJ-like protein [Haladaptatus litoreus]|uniref:YndJ-like protein n=1 Tax=Haladaptatus litoreus TaxID=553468 RepID=A0A1N6VB51_9EURY|nr:YndJ family transporter [Haladaptatus litoreus]SIQ75084.1 YndJ-like protein [Haladaptatus litoreus]